MDLDNLTGTDFKVFTIGGREYSFAEMPLEALGHLQAFIKANFPHPLEAIKPHLAGLDPADRLELLDRARREAKNWPPQIGTHAGAVALLSTEAGQTEALYYALRVRQPDATRELAKRLYRQFGKDAILHGKDEQAKARAGRARGVPYEPTDYGVVQRIFAVAFGMDDDDAAEDLDPKAI